jgi:membrane-associated phospholipid phosphatase
LTRAALAILIGLLATSPAEAAPSRRRLLALAGGVAAQVSTEYLIKDQIAADRCTWCDPPDVDAALRDRLVWNDRTRARSLSDLSAYVALPVISASLLLIESRDAMSFLDDVVPCVEAVVYTSLATQLVKSVVARQRPAVRYAAEPTPANPEDNLAFFSGHSSFAFALAVSAGTVARRRGYALEPAIWASGLALAGATAYLRVAADRHYVSDVAIGSAVGALGGYLVPQLTLPVAIVPADRGVALAGSF